MTEQLGRRPAWPWRLGPLLVLVSGCQWVFGFDEFSPADGDGAGGGGAIGAGGGAAGGGGGAGGGGAPGGGAGGGPGGGGGSGPGGGELLAKGLVAGDTHTCALARDESGFYCWGNNAFGQSVIAGPALVDQAERLELMVFTGQPAQVAPGTSHTCALGVNVDQASLACWGDNTYGQVGLPLEAPPIGVSPVDLSTDVLAAGIAQIGVGGYHGCLRTGLGPSAPPEAHEAVFCWGRNSSAQLGRDEGTPPADPSPAPVLDSTQNRLAAVSTIAAHFDHTCAIVRGDNQVVCWGENGAGQSGSLQQPAAVATKVSTGADSLLVGASDVAVGRSHSCAIVGEGGVLCWGSNAEGQLGNEGTYLDGGPHERAEEVTAGGTPLRGVRQLALGSLHSCALTEGKTVRCWGSNRNGELGRGADVFNTPEPGLVAGEGGAAEPLSGVEQIVAGGGHTCALLEDGRVLCWGQNTSRQLGTGRDESRLVYPTPVLLSPAARVPSGARAPGPSRR
ncbi:MAG TPA: hypothetical protein VFS43_09930 [Polyangiaceae bacterium]|nr:hypothetical protein [Polyangiaceae bacterium]